VETILSHLSTRLINILSHGSNLQHLDFLLEFLAAWEKRPAFLTPMAYQWCSAISEATRRLGLNKIPLNPLPNLEFQFLPARLQIQLRLRLQFRPQDLTHDNGPSTFAEGEFSLAGPACDPVYVDDTFNFTHICPQDVIPFHYGVLFPTILEIGFRVAEPGRDWSALHLDHTSHHKWVVETAFSSDDDEVIADAVSVWVICGDCIPPGFFVHCLAKRVEKDKPFSPRLRQVGICAIEHTWGSGLGVSGLEAVCLLNCLDVNVDDMVKQDVWAHLLVNVICLPTGLESLSSHYWHLLDKLPLATDFSWIPGFPKVEVMRSLEEAEDWEKLEVWMVVIWQSLSQSTPTPTVDDVEQVTLRLFLQQPSAPPRFEALIEHGSLYPSGKTKLQWICDQVQTEQPPSESLPLLYVSVCSIKYNMS
jgi:hypothetical protein